MNIKFLLFMNYHWQPSTKGVYSVQLMDEDYVNFHQQTFMQNGIYKNHFLIMGTQTQSTEHREMIFPQVWHL